MADSNKLSTSTGKEVASNLSLTIQDYNAQVINAQVGGLFNEYVDILLSLRRSVLIFKASYDDWDTMQSWLWQHVKMLQATTGPIDGLYIGYSNGDALFSTPMGVQVKMAQLRNCSFCFPADVGKPNRTYYFVNTTNGLGTPYGAGNYTRAAYNTLTRPWFIQGMLSNVSLVQLTPVYRYTSDTLGTTLIDTLFYPNGTKLGVIGLDANFLKLNPILTKLKSTPNTFIYVMQEDGTVYGNSYNESCINVNSTIVTKKPADMTNPLLKLTGTYLLGISNGNLSMLPNSSVYNLKNGSNTILFQVTLISVANGKLAIVGAPSSDYVGNIDQVIVDVILFKLA